MAKKIHSNKMALIVLHEIYGINRFIEEFSSDCQKQGWDVFCPDMLGRKNFSYTEASEAYCYFTHEVGFDFYKKIEQLVEQLTLTHDKVFIVGFSVGATIAWRCCENDKCAGIICWYGSRIRNYLLLQPDCPILLLFAEKDSFNVDNVISHLRGKPNIQIYKLKAKHGFMDRYSPHFDKEQYQRSKKYMQDFLGRIK